MHLSLWKRLLFASLPAALLVVTAEVLLRLTGAADTCPTYTTSFVWTCDPILYFRTRDGAWGVLNKQGFRGRDFEPKKPGVYRVLALGDSCTFGITARDADYIVNDAYPAALEALVAERAGAGKFEVLNGGVPGYNTYQGIMLLRTKLRGWDPDLITVRFGWNDHLISPETLVGYAFREPASPWARFLEDLLLRSKLYPFSQRLGMELKLRLQQTNAQAAPAPPREWTPNIPLQEYEHNLRRIVELGHGQGAEVWFLTAPSAFLDPEHLAEYEALPDDAMARTLLKLNQVPSFRRMMEIHDAYNAATRAVAAELEVPVVDMAEVYRGHAGEKLFSLLDFVHPTQQGYDLEAEALYAGVVSSGVVSLPKQKASVPAERLSAGVDQRQ